MGRIARVFCEEPVSVLRKEEDKERERYRETGRKRDKQEEEGLMEENLKGGNGGKEESLTREKKYFLERKKVSLKIQQHFFSLFSTFFLFLSLSLE